MEKGWTKIIFKKLATNTLQSLASWYLSEDRKYKYQQLRLIINKGVFHPGLFFSTRFMAEYLQTLSVQNQYFLELGAGSGLLSILAAQKGAKVTASDISHLAVENIQLNAKINRAELDVIQSDLFEKIPESQYFDYVFINPPYYPKNPQNTEEHAWFCGENFQYFERLFCEMRNQKWANSAQISMILSEDCELEKIKKIAAKYGWNMTLLWEKKIWWEWNYIFQVAFAEII